jgi:hypothetical protein
MLRHAYWRKEGCAGAWFDQGQARPDLPRNRLAPKHVASIEPVTDPEQYQQRPNVTLTGEVWISVRKFHQLVRNRFESSFLPNSEKL